MELHATCLSVRTFISFQFRACSSHCSRSRAACSRCLAMCAASTRDRLGGRPWRLGRAMELELRHGSAVIVSEWRKQNNSETTSCSACMKLEEEIALSNTQLISCLAQNGFQLFACQAMPVCAKMSFIVFPSGISLHEGTLIIHCFNDRDDRGVPRL